MDMWPTSHIILGPVLRGGLLKIHSRGLLSFQREQEGHCWKRTEPLLYRRENQGLECGVTFPNRTAFRHRPHRHGGKSWVRKDLEKGWGEGREGQGSVAAIRVWVAFQLQWAAGERPHSCWEEKDRLGGWGRSCKGTGVRWWRPRWGCDSGLERREWVWDIFYN